MGQRMPMQQGAAPQGQAPQGGAPEGQGGGDMSQVGELVKSTGQGLQLLQKVFTTAGAPKQAIELMNESLTYFTDALKAASGEAVGGESEEGGQSMEQAAGMSKARPMGM